MPGPRVAPTRPPCTAAAPPRAAAAISQRGPLCRSTSGACQGTAVYLEAGRCSGQGQCAMLAIGARPCGRRVQRGGGGAPAAGRLSGVQLLPGVNRAILPEFLGRGGRGCEPQPQCLCSLRRPRPAGPSSLSLPRRYTIILQSRATRAEERTRPGATRAARMARSWLVAAALPAVLAWLHFLLRCDLG